VNTTPYPKISVRFAFFPAVLEHETLSKNQGRILDRLFSHLGIQHPIKKNSVEIDIGFFSQLGTQPPIQKSESECVYICSSILGTQSPIQKSVSICGEAFFRHAGTQNPIQKSGSTDGWAFAAIWEHRFHPPPLDFSRSSNFLQKMHLNHLPCKMAGGRSESKRW